MDNIFKMSIPLELTSIMLILITVIVDFYEIVDIFYSFYVSIQPTCKSLYDVC